MNSFNSNNSRKRLATDDIKIASSSFSEARESAQITTSELLIRLEAKIVTAEKLLSEINTFLVNSTTHVILSTKPIFDEQKRSLIRLRVFIERSRTRHNIRVSPLNLSRLHDSTDFKEWNALAIEVNKLCTSIEKNVESEEAQKSGYVSKNEGGEKQKSMIYTWTVYYNRILGNCNVIYVICVLFAIGTLSFFLWKLGILIEHSTLLDENNANLRYSTMAVQLHSGEQFNSWLSNHKFVFVNFFIPGCVHCNRIMMLWSKLQGFIDMKKLPVAVAQVDCSKLMDLCIGQGINTFPLFRMYKDKVPQIPDFKRIEGMKQKLTLQDFIDYLRANMTE